MDDRDFLSILFLQIISDERVPREAFEACIEAVCSAHRLDLAEAVLERMDHVSELKPTPKMLSLIAQVQAAKVHCMC